MVSVPTSLADRVLISVAQHGRMESTDDILRDISGPGEHIGRSELETAIMSLTRSGRLITRMSGNELTEARPTKLGFREAGIARRPVGGQVGHTSHLPSIRPADGTDFRNHQRSAQGGPITIVRAGNRTSARARTNSQGDGSVRRREIEHSNPDNALEVAKYIEGHPGVGIKDICGALHLTERTISIRVHKAIALGWVVDKGRRTRRRLVVTAALPERADAKTAPSPAPAPAFVPVVPSGSGKTLADFPLVATMFGKADRLVAMARELELLGEDDAALDLLARASDDPLMGEVRELLRLAGVK